MSAPLQSVGDPSPARQERIVRALQNECGKLLGRLSEEIAPDASFIALGADSLSLLRLSQTLKDLFGIKVPFRRMIDDLSTVQSLATYLDQSLFPKPAQPVQGSPELKPVAAGPLAITVSETANQQSRMQSIFAEQLRVITMQLELLRRQSPSAEPTGSARIAVAKHPVADDTSTGRSAADSHTASVENTCIVANVSDPSHNSALYSRRCDNRQWIYAPSWMRSSLIPMERSHSGPWLLFADAAGLGDELARQLRSEGSSVLVVRVGKDYQQFSSTEWSIEPRNRNHYSNLLRDIGGEAPSQIVHLWNFGPPEVVEDTAEMAARYQSIVFLAQALNEAGGRAQLAVVSNRMHDVIGTGNIQPGKAILLGPTMAISRELSALGCRSIDFDTDGQDPQEHQTLIRQLRLEFASSASEESVAYAIGRRWIPCFEEVRVPETVKTPLRKNAVYLITGGLGGIGLSLAEHLASNYGAKLVLTGRTARSDDPGLEPLRALGAEFMVFAADVASKTEMTAVVSQTKQRFGPIHGVIHSAGIAGGGLIAFQPAQDLAVLWPKVLGTMVLQEIFQGEPLELMVLCSSLVSAVGGPGRAEYVAANAYLDACASRAGDSRQYRTVTINWDAWRDVGMGTRGRLSPELRQFHTREPAWAMTTAEALQAFEMALGTDLPRVLISARDVPAIYREYKQAGIDLLDSFPAHDNAEDIEPISDGSIFEKLLSEVQALTPEQVQTAIKNELEIQ